MTSVPLLTHSDLDAVFAWATNGPVSVSDYVADAYRLA